MTSEPPSPPGFLLTVRLLLRAARTRAAGRRKRQQELLNSRAGKSATNWGGLGFALTVVFMAILNVGAAFVVQMAVEAGERIAAERQGKIVVSSWFLEAAKKMEAISDKSALTVDQVFPPQYISSEARRIVDRYGGTQTAIEQKLHEAMRTHGTRNFITREVASPGLSALPTVGPFSAFLGSIVLILWGVMLVFQGEGLELDLQRRRHPMWEWLFTHPVPSGAIFLADMLSPIAANPIYWSAPLFVGFVYGFVYDPGLGFLAVLLIGIPVTVAAACLGKALEIGVILRFPPRSRGAMIGFMGWMGYASMMLFFLSVFALPRIEQVLQRVPDFFTLLPWPWLGLFLGGQSDGSFSFLSGILACWIVAGITVAGAVWFSVWGAQRGLGGNVASADSGPSLSSKGGTRFGRDPLYRKEFLWFIRDRSAIVQTILIPLTVASFQVFNLRGLLSNAQGAWNYLCGAGILFGTYFLWILGPKSLSSEGTALWIALTWPRGLESLLKAKAWLWSLISTGIVALVLSYAAFLFPANIWQILLVGIGWFFFGRSMAEKTVTLVTVASSSGEAQPIQRGRQWAAQLGMLTFSIGVLTQQWHIAIMGIVYSYVTAAAMWQNFRARLPYLYDPWSETLPPPPTLMHAMVAISILVEGGAVVTGIFLAMFGRENIAVAQAMSYGICSVIVWIGVSNFLSNRGVLAQDVWRWPAAVPAAEEVGVTPAFGWRWASARRSMPSHEWGFSRAGEEPNPQPGYRKSQLLPLLLVGAVGGLVLGLFAVGYLAVLSHVPVTAEILRKSREQMAAIPYFRASYAVMAVGFAPFAEEYLFRGLLFRALDREWGGWRAVVGSAAFFAVYHSPLAWLPVALLGVANALLFKKTGRLAPAVILHMVYNAVVLS
jgi:membrane protease YdiL (CAAX protease family)